MLALRRRSQHRDLDPRVDPASKNQRVLAKLRRVLGRSTNSNNNHDSTYGELPAKSSFATSESSESSVAPSTTRGTPVPAAAAPVQRRIDGPSNRATNGRAKPLESDTIQLVTTKRSKANGGKQKSGHVLRSSDVSTAERIREPVHSTAHAKDEDEDAESAQKRLRLSGATLQGTCHSIAAAVETDLKQISDSEHVSAPSGSGLGNPRASGKGHNPQRRPNGGITKNSSSGHTSRPGNSRGGRSLRPDGGGGNDEDKDDEGDDGNEPLRRHPSTAAPAERQRLFACPFYRKYPVKYASCCLRNRLTTTNYVRQHIIRSHKQPRHCPSCNVVIPNQAELDAHIRMRPPCENNGIKLEGVTPDQIKELQKSDERGPTDRRYHNMWRILFGDAPADLNPWLYNDNEVADVMHTLFKLYRDRGHLARFIEGEYGNEQLSTDRLLAGHGNSMDTFVEFTSNMLLGDSHNSSEEDTSSGPPQMQPYLYAQPEAGSFASGGEPQSPAGWVHQTPYFASPNQGSSVGDPMQFPRATFDNNDEQTQLGQSGPSMPSAGTSHQMQPMQGVIYPGFPQSPSGYPAGQSVSGTPWGRPFPLGSPSASNPHAGLTGMDTRPPQFSSYGMHSHLLGDNHGPRQQGANNGYAPWPQGQSVPGPTSYPTIFAPTNYFAPAPVTVPDASIFNSWGGDLSLTGYSSQPEQSGGHLQSSPDESSDPYFNREEWGQGC